MDRFRSAVVAAAANVATAQQLGLLVPGRIATVVLVEGESDRAAVEALAEREGRDLDREDACVVPMGGVTSIRRFLDVVIGCELGARIVGLCDEAEERYIRRGLTAAGLGTPATVADLEELGFFVCRGDLEDELIRALGTSTVERMLDARGDLELFRTFQNQPAQRERAPHQQLHRFTGTRSGRKIDYAAAFVRALDADRVPRPLRLLLDRV